MKLKFRLQGQIPKRTSSDKVKLRLATAAGCLTVMIAGMAAFANSKMKKEFGRGGYPDRRFTTQRRFYPDYSDTHSRIQVSFKSGKNTLQGYIYGMENPDPKRLLVFAHGITVGHESYINQLMWFADHGWRVFAYDATGSGSSEGTGTVGLVQSALDLDKALSYAETDDRLKDLPVYLLGHSWGGFAVCGVLNFDHKVAAAVSISGYAYPMEMMKLGTQRSIGKPATAMFMPYVRGYNLAVAGRHSRLNAIDGINHANIPVLIVHGEHDDYVDFDSVSIYAHRSEITDPCAEYMVLRGKYADHQSFFKSDSANDYQQELFERRAELNEKYGGKIPDDLHEQLVRSFDKNRINTINTKLLEDIQSYYDKVSRG